ncbi:MAG: YggS family pyridoxal phosphate-dependent enzyme [Anaerolineae bacterium]
MQRPRTSGNQDALMIAEALRAVEERIAGAAARAGRDPQSVTLVAVSKTVEAPRVYAAYLNGVRNFGENRVEEALPKQSDLPGDIVWHMIGHVQSRKVRDVVGHFALVHSIDSLPLAEAFQRRAEAVDVEVAVLLEVNVAREPQKYGFAPDEIASAAAAVAQMSHVKLQGLMAMAPIVSNPEEARPVFRGLRELRDALAQTLPHVDWRHLSMGMTDDFEVAVEEGATLVRVGRAIFGERAPAPGP